MAPTLVQRFERNTAGRDFVVGDIHGCFDALCDQMDRVQFDGSKDRIFSTGDLVDRGLQSRDALNWMRQPWFHAVRGNHEQMAVEFAVGDLPSDHYAKNGGQWFIDLPEDVRLAVAKAFLTLPVVIEIETSAGLVGIVHADPVCSDWGRLVQLVSGGDKRAILSALWSRSRIELRDTTPVSGVRRVYVGHTANRDRLNLANVEYIDTGAVFGGHLTMAQIDGAGSELALQAEATAHGD